MYPVVQFLCEFTSAFHSSEHNYSNLYTCAPYILGSSLRGAVLRALIDRHCTVLDRLHADNPGYHALCEEPCPVKALFARPTRFSFGRFPPEMPLWNVGAEPGTPPQPADAGRGMLRTRVGIDRGRLAAAEGALLSAEARVGRFRFAVMLPQAALVTEVCDAIARAGTRPDAGGIGRFRSVGWGRFRLLGWQRLDSLPVEAGYTRYRCRFRTPYVLDTVIQGDRVPAALLQHQLRVALDGTSLSSEVTIVGEPELSLRSLSFIRRWSDEHQGKENRLVAGIGSTLLVHFAEPGFQEQPPENVR